MGGTPKIWDLQKTGGKSRKAAGSWVAANFLQFFLLPFLRKCFRQEKRAQRSTFFCSVDRPFACPTCRSSTRRGGGWKARALPLKFVFLGFRREESGMHFARMSRTPGGVQKVCAKKVRAHFSFPSVCGENSLLRGFHIRWRMLAAHFGGPNPIFRLFFPCCGPRPKLWLSSRPSYRGRP